MTTELLLQALIEQIASRPITCEVMLDVATKRPQIMEESGVSDYMEYMLLLLSINAQRGDRDAEAGETGPDGD